MSPRAAGFGLQTISCLQKQVIKNRPHRWQQPILDYLNPATASARCPSFRSPGQCRSPRARTQALPAPRALKWPLPTGGPQPRRPHGSSAPPPTWAGSHQLANICLQGSSAPCLPSGPLYGFPPLVYTRVLRTTPQSCCDPCPTLAWRWPAGAPCQGLPQWVSTSPEPSEFHSRQAPSAPGSHIGLLFSLLQPLSHRGPLSRISGHCSAQNPPWVP